MSLATIGDNVQTINRPRMMKRIITNIHQLYQSIQFVHHLVSGRVYQRQRFICENFYGLQRLNFETEDKANSSWHTIPLKVGRRVRRHLKKRFAYRATVNDILCYRPVTGLMNI